MDDKSNEITAIPELLRLLDITGYIVTIDELSTQTKIAETIVAGGDDYLLPVDNQDHLFEDIHCLFEVDVAHGIDKAQHRAMPRPSLRGTDGLKFENAELPKRKNISLWCASTKIGKG